MAIIKVMLTAKEVERLQKYNQKGFPIEGITCIFKEGELSKLFIKYAAKLKYSHTKLAQKIGEETNYQTRFVYDRFIRKSRVNLLLLSEFMSLAKIKWDEIAKSIENIALGGLAALRSNIGMKIIKILLENPELSTPKIVDYPNKIFEENIPDTSKGRQYIQNKCHNLRRYLYLNRIRKNKTIYWLLVGQEPSQR